MSKNQKKKSPSQRINEALEEQKKKMDPELGKQVLKKGKQLIILLGLTVLEWMIYVYFVQKWEFQTIAIVYLCVWAVSVIAYFVYNKGFSLKGVTPDMLPAEWSDEKKQGIIDDANKRLQKSRWMVYVIAPITFVLLIDVFTVLVLPGIREALEQSNLWTGN